MSRDPAGQLPLAGPTPSGGDAEEVTLRGVVRTLTFRSPDGRFSVARVTTLDGDELSVVGPLGDVSVGEPLRVTGHYEESRNHGRQFRALSVVPELPTTTEGIERLLSSGFVDQVGPALARRIVQKFGASTLDVISDHAARLHEVEGIGHKRAAQIVDAFRARRVEVETKAFIQGLGMGPALARRVWERFGADTARVVQDNPYRLAEEVNGVGFSTADKVARSMGIVPNDPRRVVGATLYLLMKAVEDGHCALSPDELARRASEFEIAPERTAEAIRHLTSHGTAVLDSGLVYPPPLFDAEVRLARNLALLIARRVRNVPNAVLAIEPVAHALKALHPTQREAVEATMRAPLLVLTGGPGTGKTTTVRALVALHQAAGHRVLLAAPTGRAAKRLSEATKHPATTLHRLLEWTPRTRSFARDETSPLDADLVLVDEVSMLDLQLASSLLRALRPGARLVLVGDADQLPSVGPGTVLADVIATSTIPQIRLTRVFRQARESAIVRCAYEVLSGTVPSPSPKRAQPHEGERPVPPAGEVFFIKREECEDAAKTLVDTVVHHLPRSFGVDPLRDVQVLVPTRRGALGAQALNDSLQVALNPDAPRGRRGLAVGDKVMQHKNDYELEVWNGDLGVVARLDGPRVIVQFEGRDVVYDGASVDNLGLAYAITVHKSQGGEYDVVVLGLHTSHYMLLNRALLYTALTRARRLVVVVGNEYALKLAVDTARVIERHGALRRRLGDALATP